jgi:hypothetical protein
MRESNRRLGEEALRILDRLLDEKPHEEAHQRMSEVMRLLVRWRDDLVARRRAGEEGPELREALNQVNGVTSLAFGAQFPVVGVKWQRMEKTRDALREIMRQHA